MVGDVPPGACVSVRSAVLAWGTDTGSDTLDGDPSSAIAMEGDSFSAVHLSDTLSDTSVAVSDTSAGAVVVPDPLTIAVELVRNDRQVAGSRIAAAMRRHGHTVTDRTGAAVARPRGEPPGHRAEQGPQRREQR